MGDSAEFAGIEYFGISAALYTDAAMAPSPDVASGASIILDRTPGEFDGSGGTLSFNDYFALPVLSQTGRTYAQGTVETASSVQGHYTRNTLRQAVTTTYSGCGTNDEERAEYHTLWTVYTGGDDRSFTLPTPPAGWPRASNPAPYQGLIDPAATAEDDAVDWLHMTVHEGLAASTDYDALVLESLLLNGTHVALNSLDVQ